MAILSQLSDVVNSSQEFPAPSFLVYWLYISYSSSRGLYVTLLSLSRDFLLSVVFHFCTLGKVVVLLPSFAPRGLASLLKSVSPVASFVA